MIHSRIFRCWFSVVIVTVLVAVSPAFASDAGSASTIDGGVDAGVIDPEIQSLETDAAEVRDLVADKLDIAVTPTSLFEIPIGDDREVDLDAARLRALLSVDDGGMPHAKSAKITADHKTSALDAGVAANDVSSDLWRARIDLDRARLDFYELPVSRRHELLDAQSKRRAASTTLSAIDQRAADAEAQRQQALESARDARTEAARLVATEQARLLGVDHAQALFAASLAQSRDEIASRREATLGWQRRARDAAAGSQIDADRTYDDLRRALRSSRDALSTALSDLSLDTTDVPNAGPDALANLQIDIDTTDARKERDRVENESQTLADEETKLRSDRAAQLLDEIDSLNRERLGLLGSLSPDKRAAITGFTAAGVDQATSELRQLTLILRYHRHVIVDVIASLRHPSRSLIGKTLAGSAFAIFEWLAAFVAFFWWRRRSAVFLAAWRNRVRENDRVERLATPSVEDRALGFLLQVHRSLEWLALLIALTWCLPDAAQSILEVQLVTTILTWTFGAGFVVSVINALASDDGGTKSSAAEIETSALRLRSLRFVGRVVVIFGLILVISSMLVGHGTIYRWVFSTCWLASLPILLVLVQWWKNVVFRRLEIVRRKSPFQSWVLANSKGWSSFVAATAGGVHLFALGIARAGRSWMGRFDLSRRVLAYLFRRQMDKLVADAEPLVADRLPDQTLRVLGPETASTTWVETDVDAALKRVEARIRSKKGGIVAIIGARGTGKTHALQKIRGDEVSTFSIDASNGVAAAVEASTKMSAVLIDDVQRLVQPVMGGLAQFDALLAAAGLHSAETTWVLALDSIIWQFLERSRGARPLFDEIIHLRPWREPEVVELIATRNAQAGIVPSFSHLLERLPANADEIDRREALEKRASDYYRLLWDYAGGSPGVVLDAWRRSLGVDAKGNVCVRLFQALDSADLERLPDHAVFVLRAILQLSPANPADIAKATMVRSAEVTDALRYGIARGYLEEENGRYRVTWQWFRSVALFLQRRHLLGSQQ